MNSWCERKVTVVKIFQTFALLVDETKDNKNKGEVMQNLLKVEATETRCMV